MDENLHNKQPSDEQEQALFDRLYVPYQKDKDTVWAALSKELDETPERAIKSAKPWHFWVAASILLLLGAVGFMRFYTQTIEASQQLAHQLPDGSTVELNKGASLTYAPYWWWANRSVSLEGEGFFEVEKGRTFTVVSELGQTKVLGTSFNIRASKTRYEVLCTTGKVEVKSNQTGNTVRLEPNEQARLKGGNLLKETNVDVSLTLAWKAKEFDFKELPLSAAVTRLARSYDVSIELAPSISDTLTYTAFYDKPQNVDLALTLLCNTFDFDFRKTGEKTYLIEQN